MLTAKIKNTVIIIGVVIILSLVAFGIFKFAGINTIIDETLAKKKLDETIDAEINAGNVSLSTAEADSLTRKLYAAMKGIGTDENAIYEAFSHCTSRSDVYLLIKTFSVKDGKSLVEWITSELNSKERTKLNEVLANNNVNYQF